MIVLRFWLFAVGFLGWEPPSGASGCQPLSSSAQNCCKSQGFSGSRLSSASSKTSSELGSRARFESRQIALAHAKQKLQPSLTDALIQDCKRRSDATLEQLHIERLQTQP